MQNITKALRKASVATVAAGAMAVASASPAQARDRDNIDAGDVIAGAVILGGLAAILSSGKRDSYDDRYNGRHRDRNYRGYDNRRGNGRRAVERCIRAAERYANRNSYGRSNVTNIYDVDRRRDGWRIKGNMVVEDRRGGRGYRYNNRYNRRGYDEGRFVCKVRYGRIEDIDIKGIRGL